MKLFQLVLLHIRRSLFAVWGEDLFGYRCSFGLLQQASVGQRLWTCFDLGGFFHCCWDYFYWCMFFLAKSSLIEDVINIFISLEQLFEGVVLQESGNNSYLQGQPSDSGTFKLGIPACLGLAKGIKIRRWSGEWDIGEKGRLKFTSLSSCEILLLPVSHLAC